MFYLFFSKGGQRTKDEMCLHMFTYYPRMDDMYLCGSINDPSEWVKKMNVSTYVSDYINYIFVCFFCNFLGYPIIIQ